ncbi:hypothetical protein C2G38_2038006 [Gigaspora rosea]|uniref:SWIM-type domain-containing protein n=1 Tax=Gigaspora rosea TaxID=44941 RepID=A0A397VCU6_9GLOM|nr:hypothetical protein C2G38_2038006 [Gigaspora rosea]
MWGVRQITSNEIKHFVLLLDDGTHLCSCFDHCNRGIVCRHFFQIMLCTRAATFHIQLIQSRWYNDNVTSNSTEEPFLVAQKFEIEQSITMGWNGPVPYFNVLVNEVRDVNHKVINEQKLYEKAWGKARAALMVAVLRNDYKFITIFDKYINDRQEPLSDSDIDLSDSSNEDEIEIDNESLDPSELMNPHKRKGKGRPKGTNRIRCASEPSKKTKHKLHCKICGGAGHNQITCSQRQK